MPDIDDQKTVDMEARYQSRLNRYVTALRNGKPDMIPIRPFVAEFTGVYAGYTCQELAHDYRKAFAAARKCAADFDWDAVVSNMVYVWTGLTQAIDLERVPLGLECRQRERSARRRHVLRFVVVLDDDRNAVQRAAHPAARPLRVERIGGSDSRRIDGEERIDARSRLIVRGDTREIRRDQLVRGDPTRCQRVLQLARCARHRERRCRRGQACRKEGRRGRPGRDGGRHSVLTRAAR